jgi:hypothetical protein
MAASAEAEVVEEQKYPSVQAWAWAVVAAEAEESN